MAIFQKIINSFVFVFAAVAFVFWGVAAYTIVFEIIKDYENFPALYINLIILFLIVPFLIFKCLFKKETNENNFDYFMWGLNKFSISYLIAAISLFTLNFSIRGFLNSILFLFLIFAGYIFVLVLNWLKKFKTKKLLVGFISVLIVACLIIYELFILFINALAADFLEHSTPKARYHYSLLKLTDEKYRIEHFPSKLPKNIENYSFITGKSFQGYDVYYLKFKTGENYINETLDKNKNSIYKKLSCEKANEEYNYIPTNEIKNQINCTTYILKNFNNDNKYSSGIITANQNEIIFFYSNFDLKKY